MKSFASLTQITIFVRIAELGSLSAAARELNLSPSAVSKSLAQLEDQLGVLLVKRTTRSLTLTDSGRIIFERANDILADLESTLDAARQLKTLQGNLRLTCSIAFGSKQLTPIMGRYLDRHPAVSASITLDDRLTNLVEENFDLAIRITSRTDANYAARKLATIHWMYCAAPDYLDSHAPIRKPVDIADHRCLVYPGTTTNGSWTFCGKNEAQQIAVKTALDSNSSLALYEAALRGHGVACLPTYLVAADIVRGALRTVVPEYRSATEHTLYAMYYRSKYSNALVRSFIDFLVEEIGAIPPWEMALQEAVGAPQFAGEAG
ncbi:LysR family transcriptional regulator [Burkholderia sp. Bp9004]|uniref:LysR family transcriptional regulator n=1 Tax=Burkholderia sp. Bp9004 TaxID=2184559 RepID=UPI000F5DFBCF|nr:LysR family transcriptional regulator [Burkholderia sp. Bp9004]RQZ62283.1 LysR family transcriptional regulator [Burkholderia sp. Bp9004]